MGGWAQIGHFYDLIESLHDTESSRVRIGIPLLLPASLKEDRDLIMPKQSWLKRGKTRPTVGSGLWIVSFEPDAVTICCSFVPANCPKIVLVIAEGGCIVKLYKNRFEVVAMIAEGKRSLIRSFYRFPKRQHQHRVTSVTERRARARCMLTCCVTFNHIST